MRFTISSPVKTETFLVTSIEFEALSGNMTVQDGHAPALIALKEQSILVWTLATGTVVTATIHQGVIEVSRNEATLVIDRAL